MARENIVRTIFGYFVCRLVVPPTALVNYLGSHQVARLCQSVVNAHIQATKDTKVKIGSKIYVIKMIPNSRDASAKEGVKLTKSLEDIFSCPPETSKTPQESDLCSSKGGPDLDLIMKQPIFQSEELVPFFSEKTTGLELLEIPRTKDPGYIPSVREIIWRTKTHASAQNITRWREGQLRKLGSDGFSEHLQDLKKSGLDFENMVMEYFTTGHNTLSVVSPVVEAYWESLKSALKEIKNTQYHLKKFLHPELKYTGTIDCVGIYRLQPGLIEFKRISSKQKSSFYIENLLHLVACAGGVNFDPQFPIQVNTLILVYAYADGTPADIHIINRQKIELLWRMWLGRVEHFWKLYGMETHTQEKLMQFSNLTSKQSVEDSSRCPTNPSVLYDQESQNPNSSEPKCHIHEHSSTKTETSSIHAGTGMVESYVTLNCEPEVKVKLGAEKDGILGQEGNCAQQSPTEVKFVADSRDEHFRPEPKNDQPTEINPKPKCDQTKIGLQSKEREGIFKSLWNKWKS